MTLKELSRRTGASPATLSRALKEFAQEHGTHHMKFMLVGAFSKYLEKAPTWVQVKGGVRPVGRRGSSRPRRGVVVAACEPPAARRAPYDVLGLRELGRWSP
ncbi:hypothetical protein OG978_47485 (plasmid) [Streptomyces sp. NBC_01591]|uniref:hypothetical protein n=1 Tax=Streptomyces sp. NBC_01591 TaxID=2975888 RepID=UPI002DDC2128|nr:hypothetical protein [Streptomyces sp. NBC_01591]WSD74760.1 hypothetical protein OG978_47485 [Streptomyces sp. NBC_01591]